VAESCNTAESTSSDPLLLVLGRAVDAVGVLISHVSAEQWSAATPCADWSVRRLVEHLVAMNRVFTAVLADAPAPRMAAADQAEEHLLTAYRETSAALLLAFGQPGALDRQYEGLLGTASGAERLQIRLFDLLAHGWDLAQATGQPVDLPDDLVESSVAFSRNQLAGHSRHGRFDPPRTVGQNAPAIEPRLLLQSNFIDRCCTTRNCRSPP
jgi:uncharacterized protein (TIGR03086 family)